MTLRIAFCGPNTELCATLAEKVVDKLYLAGQSDATLMTEDPLREVLERTQKTEWTNNDADWLNIWVMSTRAMDLERLRNESVLVSPSCTIDQMAMQATWVGEQMKMSGLLIPGNDHDDEALYNRAGSVLQVVLNAAEEEVVTYWDFVYAVLPVATGVSIAPDNLLTQYSDFLLSSPAFHDVVRLPDNETSALDILETEVPRWKALLSSS